MDRYKYLALNGSTQAIRLLRLLPGSMDEPIQAQLVPCQIIGNIPDWEAMSYCWGNQQSSKEIHIDGLTFSVSNTVFKALQYLRQPDSSRILWIDSICINQEDIPEREQQVQLMALIYSKAIRVIVWLGEASAQQSMILKTLSYLIASVFMASRRIRRKVLRAFHQALSGRPWFQRMWIIQEVALAKEVVIQCGAWSMNWELFYELLTYRRPRFKAITPQQISLSLLIGQVDILRNLKTENAKLNILGLLHGFQAQKVTDDRDRIYSLLGLINWISEDGSGHPITFPVNYVADVAEVYRDFALWHLKETSSLGILYSAWRRKGGLFGSLPTWIPDWSSGQSVYEASINSYDLTDGPNQRPLYSAGRSRSLDFEYIPAEKGLRLTGICFDTILETMPARPIARHLWNDWVAFAVNDQGPSAYETRTDREYAFGATLSASFNESPTSDFEVPQEPMSRKRLLLSMATVILQNDPGKLNQVASHFIPYFLRRPVLLQYLQTLKLFRTSNGYLGIGNENMENGDTIGILWGGNVPVILRGGIDDAYKQTGYVSSVPRHRLISDYYIHGVMHGEAEEICRDRGETTRPIYIV